MITQGCRGTSGQIDLHLWNMYTFGSPYSPNSSVTLWFPSANSCLSGGHKAVPNCMGGCTHAVRDHFRAPGCLLRARATKTPPNTHVRLHSRSKTRVLGNTLGAVERNTHKGKSGSSIDPNWSSWPEHRSLFVHQAYYPTSSYTNFLPPLHKITIFNTKLVEIDTKQWFL